MVRPARRLEHRAVVLPCFGWGWVVCVGWIDCGLGFGLSSIRPSSPATNSANHTGKARTEELEEGGGVETVEDAEGQQLARALRCCVLGLKGGRPMVSCQSSVAVDTSTQPPPVTKSIQSTIPPASCTPLQPTHRVGPLGALRVPVDEAPRRVVVVGVHRLKNTKK
jgi:hypothetical protein